MHSLISPSVYSVWPFFACMAILLFLTNTSIFAPADTPPSPQPRRIKTLDGLRGYLALAVVFHHAAVYRDFLLTGAWTAPPSIFYAALGPLGVDLFFMITGYLFWSKLLRGKGRTDWLNFYIGRIFRIGPLFLFAFAVLVFTVFFLTGGTQHVSLLALLHQLSVGVFLGFASIHDINGYASTVLLLDGVTWTLQWEWYFYLSLLLIAWAARSVRKSLGFVLTLLILGQLLLLLYPSLHSSIRSGYLGFQGTSAHVPIWASYKIHMLFALQSFWTLFLYGMLAATLEKVEVIPKLPNAISSILVIACFTGSILLPDQLGPLFHLLLGASFYLITSGSTVFGLLVTRPARRLGDISYGIYLLQGLPQALLFRSFRSVALSTGYAYWALTLLSTILLIALATTTHVWVERPGIDAGKKLMKRLPRPRESTSDQPEVLI